MLLVGAAVLTIGFPLFDLGRELAAAGAGAVGDVLGDGTAWTPIVNTLWTASAATVLTLVIATAFALSTGGHGRRRRALVVGALVLPLFVPPFVSALSWMSAYGPGGLLDDLFGVSAPWIVGPIGVVTVLVVNAMPIAYLIVAAALDTRSEADLVRAARVAGANPMEALGTVTLPLLRPALVGAGAITFIMSANAFGIPAVLGMPAGFGTITTRLYRDLVFSADPAAFDRVLVLAALLGIVTLVVVGGADRSARGSLRLRVEPSGPRSASAPSSPVGWAIIVAYTTVTAIIPFIALALSASSRAVGLAPTPGNWTLQNFGEAFSAGTIDALRTSLVLAVIAATVVLVLGGLLVSVERRRRSGFSTFAALGFAVPGSVLAVAVLLAYGPWLRDTILLILIAYVAKFWALGHRTVAGSADAVSPELTGAARLSGAGPATAVRTVTLPLLRPALVAAWLIVFMFALHELTISSLLYGPGSETLAVAVLNLQQLGDPTVTAALAVTLTVGAAAIAAPLIWVARRTVVGRRP